MNYIFTALNYSEIFEMNNYGPNMNFLVNKTRYKDIPESKLKTILFWNLKDMDMAYGFQKYDFGEGKKLFYYSHNLSHWPLYPDVLKIKTIIVVKQKCPLFINYKFTNP